ncbi:MAG: cell division protein SepF [Clostridiales bacterium]|nr:cell division protein SepF [Clostridiales bacterium]
MGFFDFLSKSKTENKKSVNSYAPNRGAEDFSPASGNIEVFKPKSFDEVAKIIDKLLEGQPAIVHLTDVRETTAQRVIDLLSGAIYAINGNLCELKKDVYIFTPSGVKTY